jgi:hypothetical protein
MYDNDDDENRGVQPDSERGRLPHRRAKGPQGLQIIASVT